jgi:hypothetical protein
MPNSVTSRTVVLTIRSALRISNFKPLARNTLVGFCSVEHPSGLVLHEVAIHHREGKWWASPSARPILVDRQHAVDERGKGRWQPLAGRHGRTGRMP